MPSPILTMPHRIFRKLKSLALGCAGNTHTSQSNIIKPDLQGMLAREYPNENLAAKLSIEAVVNAVKGVDLDPLARHSPALKGFEWTSYLRLSAIRMTRVQRALRQHGINSGKIADIGSYFGNFSLMLANNGYQVTAVDGYTRYGPALRPVTNLLKSNNVTVLNFDELGDSFEELPSGSFDVVLSMGVIEHIPHTPRLFLEAMNRLLRPGGLLVIDTPNLGYLHTREKLSRGESIFCPLELQYDTAIPFEGHHREYTSKELLWMLNHIGHEVLDLQFFNFSMFALSEICGDNAEKYQAMEKDASLRELMLTVSRKK